MASKIVANPIDNAVPIDGVTDAAPAILAALATLTLGGELRLAPGSYRLASSFSTPINVTWVIDGEAELLPDSGVTLTILGNVDAPYDSRIFGGLGTVAVPNMSNYSLNWYGAGPGHVLGGVLTVTGAATFDSTLAVGGTLGVTGAATLQSTLAVAGAATLSSTLATTGAATLGSTLGVTGAATLDSTLAVAGAATLSGTLGVTGAATLQSTLAVAGAATLSSTLAATSATFSGMLTANGGLTMTGALVLAAGGTTERSASTALLLQRSAVTGQATGLRFNSASGGTIDQAIMLKPGSEDLVFGRDSGGGFTELLLIKGDPNAGVWLPSVTAATPSSSGFGGGLRLSLYGNPTTDVGAYGFGISGSSLWAMTGGGQFNIWTDNAGTPVQMLNLNQGGLSLYAGGPGTLAGGTGIIQFRSDNYASDPGLPWYRSDGSIMVFNPHGSGGVYFCWDNPQPLYVGGNLQVLNQYIYSHSGLLLGPGAPGAGPDIHSDGTNLYIETNGAGNIYLRPQGYGIGTNAARLDSGGNLTLAGGLTVAGTTTLSGAVNTGSDPLTVGAGGLASNGAAQFNSTLNVSGLVSIQGITTNSTVTHQSVGRLVLSGATTIPSGWTSTGLALGITVNGANYWIPLSV